MSVEKEIETLEEQNPVTANANAGDKAPKKLEGETPGNSTSAADLGGPVVKPDDTASIGKKAAAAQAHEGDKSLKTKPSAASAKMEETEVEEEVVAEKTEIEVDVKADVEALLNGEEFSEDFKFKAATIFEAAVKAKVVEQVEKFESVYEEKLAAATAELKESMETRVDAHLDYVSEQWVKENQLAIDSGLRNEITEEFITGLKNLFTESYIEIPDDKYDVLEGMTSELDEMETKLNEQIETNVELNKKLGTYIKNGIVSDVSEGLAHTQKEKFASLTEGVEFDSEESFREKVETIKENYFPKSQIAHTEDLVEEKQEDLVEGPMAAYKAAIDRWK
jgi:hypothetical protein|tara:strand:+ start:580 stop:1587 length:1008 start_codon:yes stop_codon:yes gene_type:complete